MNHIILLSLASLLLYACAPYPRVVMNQPLQPLQPEPTKVIEAVGHSSLSSFKNYPVPQQKLLAIRGAKLDAYRNLAEEVHGVRIKGNTTVKDMVIENDSYRAYVDATLRGAHLMTVSPKGDGIYEAEVSLSLTPKINNCLRHLSPICNNSSNNPIYQSGYNVDSGVSIQTTRNYGSYPNYYPGYNTGYYSGYYSGFSFWGYPSYNNYGCAPNCPDMSYPSVNYFGWY